MCSSDLGGELFHSLNLEISKRSDQIFLLASLRAEQPIPKDSIDLLEKQILALQFHLSDSDLKIIFEHNKTAFFQNLEKPHMFGIINASLLAQYGADGLIQSIQFEEYLKAANELAKIENEIDKLESFYTSREVEPRLELSAQRRVDPACELDRRCRRAPAGEDLSPGPRSRRPSRCRA